MRLRSLFTCLSLTLPAALPADQGAISFSRQIAPILADQCLECHREEKAKGSYRLDTFAQLTTPGDSGALPITPGKPENSPLYQLLVTRDDADRMPKKADPLPAPHITLIRRWIAEGARFDGASPRAAIASLIPDSRPQAPEKYPRPLPVTAIALDRSGATLATSGYFEVLLWDSHTGQLLRRIGGMPQRIHSIAFIGGGPSLAVAGGLPGRAGEVWLVNSTNPAERRRLVQTRDSALCAAASPTGSHLVTAGADNRVRCFSLPDGRPLWNIEMHADWITALAMSPDGRLVATAGRDRTARVIETTTGIIEGTFTGHTVPVTAAAFTPDGKTLLTAGSDGEIRFSNPDGTPHKDRKPQRPSGRTEVLALTFATDTTCLAATVDGQINSFAISDTQKEQPTKRKAPDQNPTQQDKGNPTPPVADVNNLPPKLTTLADRVNALLTTSPGPEHRLIIACHDGTVHILRLPDLTPVLTFTASPGY